MKQLVLLFWLYAVCLKNEGKILMEGRLVDRFNCFICVEFMKYGTGVICYIFLIFVHGFIGLSSDFFMWYQRNHRS